MSNVLKSQITEVLNARNIQKSSLKTYLSTLSNLGKRSDIKIKKLIHFTSKSDEIMKFLMKLTFNKRKSILTALCHVSEEAVYEQQKQLDYAEHNAATRKQTLTAKEAANWMSWTDIMKVYKKMELRVNFLFKTVATKETILIYKNHPNLQEGAQMFDDDDRQLIQDFHVLMMYIEFPPRRAEDVSSFMVRDYNTKTDNHVDFKHNKIVFNNFKTQKSFGRQVFELPTDMKKHLLRYMKVFNVKNNYVSTLGLSINLTNTNITHALNRVVKPKKISVNMLRHAYITDFHRNLALTGNSSNLELMSELAEKMAHSVETQLTYVRHDAPLPDTNTDENTADV